MDQIELIMDQIGLIMDQIGLIPASKEAHSGIKRGSFRHQERLLLAGEERLLLAGEERLLLRWERGYLPWWVCTLSTLYMPSIPLGRCTTPVHASPYSTTRRVAPVPARVGVTGLTGRWKRTGMPLRNLSDMNILDILEQKGHHPRGFFWQIN